MQDPPSLMIRFQQVLSMPTAAPNKGAPSLVLLLWLVLAVSMAGAPRRTWLCTLRLHTDGADILHSVPYYLAPLFDLSDGCTGLSYLRCARVLTGCASFRQSERQILPTPNRLALRCTRLPEWATSCERCTWTKRFG